MFNKLMNNFASLSNINKLLILIFIDTIILWFSLYLSISVRVGYFFYLYDARYLTIAIISPLICIPIFFKIGLYSNVIRYINFNFIIKIFLAIFLYSLVWGAITLIINPISFPRSVIIINMFISLTLITNTRVLAKLFFDFNLNYLKAISKNIIIYGINHEGISLFESIKNNKAYRVVSFIDESKEFQNRYIYNLKVRSIRKILNLNSKFKIHEIYITKKIRSKEERNLLSKICDDQKIFIKTKTNNEWNNLNYKNTSINLFEKIEPSEFLKRKIVESDNVLLSKNIFGKIVLITGGGGSIGSEIVSQLVDLEPSQIIIFEQNEFALFKVGERLKKFNKKNISVISILGSTTNKNLVEATFKKYNPFIVFHTAAYKHVSIVENNVIESFYNNVFGTHILTEACLKFKIKNFVNISTDKAVLPSTFMGSTKRISEMLIQVACKSNSFTKYSIVRFGNVVGSSGSVIPIFRKQIKAGGPLTVTHPEVTRYFMSISEAAQLVMQSSSLGKNGDIFILDMGKPIKIYELAKKMIEDEAEKYNHNKDQIKIIFTGLPEYEKINEDLYYNLNKKVSQHPKIYIDQQNSKIHPDFYSDFLKLIKNYNTLLPEDLNSFIIKYIKFKIRDL